MSMPFSRDGSGAVHVRASRVRGLVANLAQIVLPAAPVTLVARPFLAGGEFDLLIRWVAGLAALCVLVTVFLVLFNRGDQEHEKEVVFDDRGVRYQWFWNRREVPWGALKGVCVSRTPPGRLR